MACILIIWLSVFLLIIPSSAYYASSVIKVDSKSLDISAALGQAAQILNVAEPGKSSFSLNSSYRFFKYIFQETGLIIWNQLLLADQSVVLT